ncbi:MBL fold metallo-hydrolase [Stratiformator vulcanicus]|uniref:Metallo-beta-lactamase superfamily protein n=1 Tax=Stratiformator vulcanicus TaxID=2527980 RepID=A0A517R3M1_9PLAN|nr:MBL fold metallo-hydrolase [Stratiformator vulcanicus]QDT38456.1 Metallo-beta-lactamase superfamily protein [Stratiformator vulcanicus]
MLEIRHLNCGWLQSGSNPRASCHCLLLQQGERLVLIDSGIGLKDIADPEGRIGREMLDIAGFQFHEELTAYRQIEAMDLNPAGVTHVVLTHGDPDHTGGLADFPDATVHLSAEELAAIEAGDFRYPPAQFEHRPRWRAVGPSEQHWFEFEARPLDLGLDGSVQLIPLFGHTLGHCGVAIQSDSGWLFYIGDAYFLRGELTDPDHPVGKLSAQRAVNDPQRRTTLETLKRLHRDHSDEITMFGYHDETEFSFKS